MVRNFHNKKRYLSRLNRYFIREKIPDKVVVENSKRSYLQYFIIPSIFSFVGIQYFKISNFNPAFLLLILVGFLFSFVLNIFLSKKLRKNPPIILNNKGLTFSMTRTIFWNEIMFYHLRQRNSLLQVYIKCESEQFFLEFENLPITKVKLKVLINSFYKKYCNKKSTIYEFLEKDFNLEYNIRSKF